MKKIFKGEKVIIFTVLFLIGYVLSSHASGVRETPVVKVVRDNREAVVNISTERIIYLRESPFWGNYDNEFDLLFESFFRMQRPLHTLKLKSVGSGVIIDKSGVIVTNAHVINMASNIYVILNDGTSVEGEVMYAD